MMKRATLFIAVVLVLIILPGCTSSNSTDTENTVVGSMIQSDNNSTAHSVVENTEGQINSTIEELDTTDNPDIESATDQSSTMPVETGMVEYEVQIGDSISETKDYWRSGITTTEFDDAVIWKDRNGYHIACAGEDEDTIYAIVLFSDDLELLEAEGLEPIESIAPMEKWLGKTEEEFIAVYGPYHCEPGCGFYMPSYISKDGKLFRLDVEQGTIMSIYSFSIDLHSISRYSILFRSNDSKIE